MLLSLPAAWQPGQRVGVLDAFFTATSALCVTGLVVRDTASTWSPFGQVVILLLIQVGGLGVMTMSTLLAFLLGKRIFLQQRLLLQEALGSLDLGGVVRITRYIILTALTVEAAGALLLTLRFFLEPATSPGRALWLGIFHAVSAFNNAGFDLFGTRTVTRGGITLTESSLMPFVGDAWVNLVVTGLIILGGLGYPVLADLVLLARAGRRGRPHRLSLQTRMVLAVTGFLLVAGTLLIYLWERGNPATLGPLPEGSRWLAAWFQAVTARTAGYNTVSVAALSQASAFFLIMLMFVGASPGGTGGGVKTTALGVIALAVRSVVRGERDIALGARRVRREALDRALAVTALALFWVTAVILVLASLEDEPLLPLAFEAMSAFGTVGLSLGVTPELSDAGKLLVALTMFLGRLGPVTLAAAIARRQAAAQPLVQLPEERVMIG